MEPKENDSPKSPKTPDEHIDFHKEVKEFIDNKYVKSVQFTETTQDHCNMQLISLEDYVFDIKCSIAAGIEILSSTYPLLSTVKFESFEQLLNTYSQKYVKTFQSELMEKLNIVHDQREIEENNEKKNLN